MTRLEQLIIFLCLFATILALSHFYLWSRLAHYFLLNATEKRYTAFFFGGMALLSLLSVPVSRSVPREFGSIIAWAAFPWLGILLLLFSVMIITDIIWLILAFLPHANDLNPERRQALEKGLGIAALGVTTLLGVDALWNGLRPVSIKEVPITLDRWPQSLDGLRIVQISDLHIGPTINGVWLREVVNKIKTLQADLIVITGDLVDGTIEELAPHVASLTDLAAPLGVYFITGNHEYYAGVDAWCEHIAGLGIRVLRNEHVTLSMGSEKTPFDLAGIEDLHSHQFPGHKADLPKALEGRDADRPLILLAHQPAAIEEAAQHGVDLQLSGHTHGGQIWPFSLLVHLQQPYVIGLHRHRDTKTHIYVSAGTGYWGPPMRLGTEAEITHITLRSPEAS